MRFAIRILLFTGLLAFLMGPGAATAWSCQVQINFTAKVLTVAGTPFGLGNIKDKTMTGYFFYDTGATDKLPFDVQRGTYDMSLPFSGFTATVDGTTFVGTKTPQVTIENIGPIDTIRYLDGTDPTHPTRIMTVNGVALPTATVGISFTSDKNPLNTDKLPDPFPFAMTDTLTFSMSDKNGTLLMQFVTFSDSAPVVAPGIVPVKISVSDKRAHFTVDGTDFFSTKTFQWPAGSSHVVDFPVNEDGRQYSPLATSRWFFGGWAEASGLMQSSSDRSLVIVANAGVELLGTVGGFQHVVQINFFGDAVDMTTPQAGQAIPPTCGLPGLNNPATLRSGMVYMDGQCYWQSFKTWVAETPHVFNAFPFPGFAFLGWMGGTADFTSQFRSVTIQGPTIFEARFTPARRVRFRTDPAGLQVTVDDVEVLPVSTNCPQQPVGVPATVDPLCVGDFDFAPNSVHKISVRTPQHDAFSGGWVFDTFTNGMGNNVNYTVGPVTFNDNYDTLVAKFVPGVSSVISSKPIGVPIGINGNPVTTSEYLVFKPGEQVQLIAPATATVGGRKYTFQSWSDGGGREHTATIPKDASKYFNLTANYSVESQIMVDSTTPNASVLVDGVQCTLPCAIDGDPGREVRIEPAPVSSISPLQKMDFVRWTDGATPARIETLAGQDSRRLIAEFRNSYLLQLNTNPDNGATFETTPASTDHFFAEGTTVTVSAKPKGGFLFNRWSGDAVGAQPAATLKLDRSRNALALLDRVPYLPENPVRNAATNVAGPVAPGSVITITGESLAFEYVVGPDNPLSQAIYGTSVAVDYYRFLPLKFVSPQQINAVLPSDLTPGEHTISVRRSGYDDVFGKFIVAPVSPGLFRLSETDDAVVLGYRPDGSQLTADNPGRPGETITVLGTGLGAYQLTPVDGVPIPDNPPYTLSSTVEVFLAGTKLDSATAAGQPGQTGVVAIKFKIPTNSTTSIKELTARIQDQESPAVLLPTGLPGAPANDGAGTQPAEPAAQTPPATGSQLPKAAVPTAVKDVPVAAPAQ